MKTVFVAKRVYDCEPGAIVGIFESKQEADQAIARDIANGYGDPDLHEVAELDVGRYFDIDEPGAHM